MDLNLGLVFILFAIGNVLKCDAVLPHHLPILQQGNAERGDIIERYYHLGMNYEEILMFIGLTHGIYLSICQQCSAGATKQWAERCHILSQAILERSK